MTSYTYDSGDHLTSITYPSGRTVNYTRNVLGQVTAVDTSYDMSSQTVADAIAYRPFGPLSALIIGNGLGMARFHDQQYRLSDQITGTVQDPVFVYDAAGNIDAMADAMTPVRSQAFVQDALHRIDEESGT